MRLQRELNTALWEADNDTGVDVIILCGAGRLLHSPRAVPRTPNDLV